MKSVLTSLFSTLELHKKLFCFLHCFALQEYFPVFPFLCLSVIPACSLTGLSVPPSVTAKRLPLPWRPVPPSASGKVLILGGELSHHAVHWHDSLTPHLCAYVRERGGWQEGKRLCWNEYTHQSAERDRTVPAVVFSDLMSHTHTERNLVP